MRLAATLALLALLAGCSSERDYDPLATASEPRRIGNVEAGIPPQCYTKTDGRWNPCWTCHTTPNGRNLADDWELQQRYDFSERARRNAWSNLYLDRSSAITAQGDTESLAYIRQDNYTPLRRAMRSRSSRVAWSPDFDYASGFDEAGFARDGSGWRAFRYKPFPGEFWPSNGSAEDVAIRLPAAFRSDAQGRPSAAIYRINLAILETAIATPDNVDDATLQRSVEPLDERIAGIDLDGDGRLGSASEIRGLPAHYAGGAAQQPVRRYDYPVGTEFLHSLRYLDPEAPGMLAARFKEVRYAVKRASLDDGTLQRRVQEEAIEQDLGALPRYAGTALTGQTNAYGWRLLGYIEDAQGRLRLQTREEQLSCMGCHTGLGVTVDQTFSYARKLPGADGWRQQDLAGMQDAPQAGSDEPETLRYFRRAGGGDALRANDELRARYFPGGTLDEAALLRAAPGGSADLRELLMPSRERALALNKAYRLIVREQGYAHGREAVLRPVANVHRQIGEPETGLAATDRVYKDGRLWLDWDWRPQH